MSNQKSILNLISEIRDSNVIMEDLFLKGACCNFYFILKSVFPTAEAYFNIDHVITKIDNRYYDITGEIPLEDVVKGGYIDIKSMYTDKYKTDDSLRKGEMYDLSCKPNYKRK